MKKPITGWAFKYNEVKGHYFNNSIKALCGKELEATYTLEDTVNTKQCCNKCLNQIIKINSKR